MLLAVHGASAQSITARSGTTTLVHIYQSWNDDCTPNTGVVRVVRKPEHGKLTPSKVTSVIRRNRFSTVASACIGRTLPSFRVDYTPARGYHGLDSFVIEAIFGRRQPITDVYTVSVE